MLLTFDEIPGWQFEIDEISAGVYKARATSEFGITVSYEGTDPDILLTRCKIYAKAQRL